MKRVFTLAVALVLATPIVNAQQGVVLEEMTWTEVRDAQQNGVDTVLITIGATEQHGPQTALGTDSFAGNFLGTEIAMRIGRAVVAPNIRIGASSHHLYFPGTLSARNDVLGTLLREYVHSLAWHGFRHIALIPTHGGNFPVAGTVARELSELYPYLNIIAFTDTSAYKQALASTTSALGIDPRVAGSHAGASETSRALAIRPDMVRMNKAEAGYLGDPHGIDEKMNMEGTPSITLNGSFGDARAATREAGEAYLAALTTLLSDFVRESRAQWEIPPPIQTSYREPPAPSGPLGPGVILRRAKNFDGARAFFRTWIQANPEDIEGRIELARTAVIARNFDEARLEVTQLLRQESPATREKAYDELALIGLYEGRFKQAIDAWKDASEHAARSGYVREEALRLLRIGFIQKELGMSDQATESLENALRVAESYDGIEQDTEVLHLAGLLDIKQGRLHKAHNRLRDVGDVALQAASASNASRFHHLSAELLLAQGRVEDALVSVSFAIKAYDSPLYWETLARVYTEAGRYTDAVRELTYVIELTDTRLHIPIQYVKSYYQLGWLYEKMGRAAEAKALYERFLEYWGDSGTPIPEVASARQALAAMH